MQRLTTSTSASRRCHRRRPASVLRSAGPLTSPSFAFGPCLATYDGCGYICCLLRRVGLLWMLLGGATRCGLHFQCSACAVICLCRVAQFINCKTAFIIYWAWRKWLRTPTVFVIPCPVLGQTCKGGEKAPSYITRTLFFTALGGGSEASWRNYSVPNSIS